MKEKVNNNRIHIMNELVTISITNFYILYKINSDLNLILLQNMKTNAVN